MRMRLQPGPSPSRCGTTVIAAALGMTLVGASCVAQTTAYGAAPGSVRGSVTDSSGSVVVGAIVTLQPAGSTSQRTTITDQAGAFHFSAVEPGAYSITITALGFAERKTNVSVLSGENPPLPAAVLQVAPAVTKVDVGLTQRELAVEQVHGEEKQRVLGIFPNFFVSYQSNAAPLTAAQKFQLGWKTIIDPEVLIGTALVAGIEQARNSYPEFGQGMEGYGKRLGAAYADRVSGVFIGHVLTQSVFHQDPRYFYKGTGSFRSRFLYAIATAFVVKGDNGHWQPDYSDVIGGLAAGEISTLYYPASSRQGLRLFHNVLLGFGGRAGDHLVQEFIYKKLTTHVPKIASRLQPLVREGTPVTLISVENMRSTTPENARPIDFVLEKDLEADGVVVAKAGSKAVGQATYIAVPPASAGGAEAIHLSLENVYLKIGNTDVPLRSTEKKTAIGAPEYHWLEDTGRIVLTLYLAQNITLPPAQ